MTSSPSQEKASAFAGDHPLIVEWEQSLLRFRLFGTDPEIVERTRTILQFWMLPTVTSSTPADCISMLVEKVATGYRVTTSLGGEPAIYSDCAITVRAIEMNAALALLDRHNQVLTVHAGLLCRDNRGVVIVGPSQSGKSTLSCALWHAGWQLLSDDVALLDSANATATPLLRRVSLRDPSRELLGEEFWARMLAAKTCDQTEEGYVFHPDELTNTTRAHSTPVNAVIFLARNGAPPLAAAQAERIEAVRALVALAPYTNSLRHTDMGTTMRRLGPLLDRVPAFDLARGPLDDMIQAVERLVNM